MYMKTKMTYEQASAQLEQLVQEIEQGSLGIETFVKIMTHPLLRDKPMILETPNELPGYQAEIALLRSKI